MAATRILRPAIAKRLRDDLATVALNSDDPVPTHVERQLLIEPLDERRSVSVQERHKPNCPLLWLSLGKGERTRVHELTPQGFVAALRGMNHFAVEGVEIVPHATERGLRRPLEGR